MAKIYKLAIGNSDTLESINSFFKKLLSEKVVDSLMVPQETPNGKSVVQTLVKNLEEIKSANPFAPILPTNSGTLIAYLTVDKPKEKIGAVMRSCEIRATIELAKIKQVDLGNLIIIGVDCMGTYESRVYQDVTQKFDNAKALTDDYLSKASQAQANLSEGKELRDACRGCEYPNPINADIAINFLGCDVKKEIFIQMSDKVGEIKPESLGLASNDDVSAWEKASKACREARAKVKDEIIKETLESIKDVKGFLKQLEHCRRCYNCRKECPICYCRECIFDSQTFDHSSSQYSNWAQRKGRIRMPTDTLLFHLTRLNHMVISCVACGQCSSACPNDIPIAKIFKSVGSKVQGVFDYKPGEKPDEEIPQSVFKEDELHEMGEEAGKGKK